MAKYCIVKYLTALLEGINLCDCSIREYQSFYCFVERWSSLHQMWPGLGKPVHINWIPLFVCTWKLHSCITQKYQLCKYLTMDGQVCFHRRLFTHAVKPRWCISRPWGALIGLQGVPPYQAAPNGSLGPPCGLHQFWSHTEGHSTAAWVQIVALDRLRLPTRPRLPPPVHPL